MNGCEEFEILLILFSWEAWFFGIHIDLLYQYCFPVSLDMLTYHVVSCHLPDITLMSCYPWHPAWYTWLL